jgi:hypothetical protein
LSERRLLVQEQQNRFGSRDLMKLSEKILVIVMVTIHCLHNAPFSSSSSKNYLAQLMRYPANTYSTHSTEAAHPSMLDSRH